ncbi:MAG: ABC transporter permease [Oscillospiraceae bacterium]|nr:ABC transporter permease [Oscillospiraceae bacterium]
MSSISKSIRRTALDRKMDKIRALEESGKLGTKLTNRTLRKLMANKLAVFGAVMFVVICVLCFAAPLFTKWAPGQISLRERMVGPGAEHLFGTDQMGRDIWSRMLYGGRISIVVGLGSALGAALIGVSLGMFVGYKCGWLDALILKISDVFLSFPQMVLIIIIVALVGQSLQNMIIIFILTGWPSMYRMARSKVLSLKEEEFVQALRAFGISDLKIAFKHMLPNTVGPIVVNITLSTAMFILQEASLSVLGYGVPQEIATWGNIINVITNAGVIRYDWLGYWWMWLPCAIMLILFVLSINFIGDGLRDASDPTQIG